MKKILMIGIIAFLIFDSGFHAEAFGLEGDVSGIYIQSLNGNQYSGNLYDYETTNPTEIEYILYLVNSFCVEEGKIPFLYESGFLIRVTCDSEETYGVIWDFGIKLNEREYWIEKYEFERFIEEIKALKNGLRVVKNMGYEPSMWAKEDVLVAEKKFVPKWNQFNYTERINRLEACQIISGYLNKTEKANFDTMQKPFDDVNDQDVSLLYFFNIINGTTEREFRPYDLITREEVAKVLSNVWHFVNPDNEIEVEQAGYNDYEEISDWAKGYVDEITTIGIFKGDDSGNFNPKANMTKEEVIVTLVRLLELEEKA